MSTSHRKLYMPDFGHCPSCYADLVIKPDDRFETGYALECKTPDCSEFQGCWPAPKRDVEMYLAYVAEG